MNDPFNLDRFVDAQDDVYTQVLDELREGRKRSHWMWFVFPQIQGLGHSEMAHAYAISSLEEARAYLGHPVLGPRLIKCATLVTRISGKMLREILGPPDDLKFCSSMTLFAIASPETPIFEEALAKYCGGKHDPRTVAELEIDD